VVLKLYHFKNTFLEKLEYTEGNIQGASKIHGINSGMSSSHVDNQNNLYQHRSGNA
jgi:hypothetical protein